MRKSKIFLLALTCAFACSKQTQQATKEEEQPPKKSYAQVPITALDPNKMVPVGMCRVVGTVMSVDSSLKSSNTDDPCSKAQCFAMVRIDSILGCGSSFGNSLSVGSSVRVRFMYTLAPSKEIFPQMSPPLSGLRIGSQFRALVQSAPEAKGYTVDSYEVQ